MLRFIIYIIREKLFSLYKKGEGMMPRLAIIPQGDSRNKKETSEVFWNLFQILEKLRMCYKLATQEVDTAVEFIYRMLTRESACDPHLGKEVRLS